MNRRIIIVWAAAALLVLCGTAFGRDDEFRVTIKTDNFQDLYHDSAVISSDGRSITLVDYGQNFVSESPVTLLPTAEGILVANGAEELLMGSPVWVYPDHACRLILESIKRGDAWEFSPSYRGFLEVNLTENGQLQIINTVKIEEYLYGVVPSEMPSSAPLAALCAQAVASRTFVVRAIIEARAMGRNYHVDDSVFAQVYNNRQEDLNAKQAVDQTRGLVMVDQDNLLVKAYFHSTSCGYTAASHEVWGGGTRDSFPGRPTPYLLPRSVLTTDVTVDWNDDADVLRFLKNKAISGYERKSPWFRWEIGFTRAQLEATINANLASLYQIQPQFVETLQDDGRFASTPVPESGIGRLKDLRVAGRGGGGNLLTLEIVGSNGTFQVSKELNIRNLIRPSKLYTNEDIVIHRMQDQIVNYPMLPSTSIAFEIIRDAGGEIAQVIIYGGGIGHGVGMSQWGARGMAEAGYDYGEILKSFYSDIDLIDIYTVRDWQKLVFPE
ncbi:MAG TPA: SpoIID/LytB domain-containing protein [Limnochordia bacterium]|nr:SpoIID/LytB domain-containing protein [Limnochordia bacterium]